MKKFDSNIYISIRWAGFILASIVSAFFNLYLISGLDNVYFYLLAMISFTLEITKISSLISGNIFKDIGLVIKSKKVFIKEKLFYSFYLMFALFSIFCSLAFSITVTDKKDVLDTADGMRIEASINQIQDKLDEIEAVKQLSISDIFSHPDYIFINNQMEEFNNEYNEKRDLHTKLTADRQRLGVKNEENTEEYDKLTAQINAAYTEYSQALRKYNEAKAKRETQIARLTEIKNNSSEELSKLNVEIETLKELYSLTTPTPLIELQARLDEYTTNLLKNSGSEKMFVILSNMFGLSSRWLKFYILLFLSILIELTVWQCGPSIKITRKVLYYFRNSLPSDLDVNELLNAFEKENQMYEELKSSNKINQSVEDILVKQHRRKRLKRKVPREVLPTIDVIEAQTQEEIKEQPIIKNIPEKIESEPVEKKEEIKEQSPIHADDVAFEEKSTTKNRYRFGKATVDIKDRLVDFINECIEFKGEFKNDPETAAKNIKLNQKAKEVFLNRLMNIRLGDNVLVYKNQFDIYCSNFSARDIINYVTEVIND